MHSIQRRNLASGMSVLAVPRPDIEVVTVMLLYRIGSAGEMPSEQGMAHFLEHMMFKGSRNYPAGAIDQVTQRLGGENNAFTSRDYTAYWHLLPTRNWVEALAIERDRMLEPTLDADEFQSERNVVLEELAMYADEAQEALSDDHYSRIFPLGHPYHHPVIGSVKTLKAMTVDSMRSFHERWVRADNSVLIVIGGVEAEEIFEQAEKYFSRAPLPPFLPIGRFPIGGQKVERSLSVQEMEVETPRIRISWPCGVFGGGHTIVADFAEEFLAGTRSSALNLAFKEERQWVSQLNASAQLGEFGGVFSLDMDLLEGVSVLESLRLLEKEIAKVLESEIEDDSLKRIRTKLESSVLFEQEKTDELAFALSPYVHAGNPRGYFEQTRLIQGTSGAMLRQFLQTAIRPELATIGVVVPKGQKKSIQKELKAFV